MTTLTREQFIAKLVKLPVGSEVKANGETYFRIDEEEFKVYPPGTTDLDDGAFFCYVEEIDLEVPQNIDSFMIEE